MRVITGDCRDILPTLPADSVHCCVTSPPYWCLRNYGVAGQIGLEPTFTEFIDKMVEVFREVRRVLRPDGTLFLNLGDSYAGSGKGGNPEGSEWAGFVGNKQREKSAQASKPIVPVGLKPKDLVGIPWRVAIALQADGWWLRQDIIWSKPNPMPESVTDRCTKAHEYLFLLTKAARYFYDAEAIREPQDDYERGQNDPALKGGTGNSGGLLSGRNNTLRAMDQDGAKRVYNPAGRNKRSVWDIATSPFPQAHFATFPPALVEPCIKAGTSEKGCCGKCGAPWERVTKQGEIQSTGGSKSGARASNLDKVSPLGQTADNAYNTGAFVQREKITLGWQPTCTCQAAVIPCTVLDPFGGAGTTGLVADRLQRNAVLIELNPTYAEMARRRINDDAPLFAEAAE